MPYYNNKISRYLRSQYLTDIDLINKYGLKSVFFVPNLKEIVFELPLNRLAKTANKQENLLAASKGLIIFYLLFGRLPEIVYQKADNTKIKKIYSFKYKLTKKTDLNSFLSLYFLNCLTKTDLESFSLFKKRDNYSKHDFRVNKHLVLSKPIYLQSFFEIQDLFKEKGWDLNEDIFLNASFIFSNTVNNLKPNKMIQNIYPFWMARQS